MSKLEKRLLEYGFPNYSDANKHARFKLLCEGAETFYQAATKKLARNSHSDTSTDSLKILLGVFGHRFEQTIESLQKQRSSVSLMQQAIEDNLPAPHASKFTNQLAVDTEITASIYLFLQGRLGMDYSLANDYSLTASQALSLNDTQSEDPIRISLNKFYYDGKRELKRSGRTNRLWKWFEKRFN